MTDEKKPDPGHTPHDPVPSSGAKGENTQNEPNAKPQAGICCHIEYQPPNIIVNVTPSKEDKWTTANRISMISVVVTIILIVVTYGLFHEAQNQTTIADSTFNGIRNQFVIENRPYLQIGDVTFSKLDTIKNGIFIHMTLRVLNFGKFPALFYKYDNDDLFWDSDDTAYMNSFKRKNHKLPNVLLANESQGGYPINVTIGPIGGNLATAIQSGTRFFYIFGELEYSCPMTDKHYRYSYIYKLHIREGAFVDILKNTDVEIK